MSHRTRRRFLVAAGSALAAALAGCQDGGGGSTPTAGLSPTASATTTPTAAPTDEETPTATDAAGPPKLRARTFLVQVAQGNFEAAHGRFTPEAAEEIPLEDLRSVWQAQEEELGAFQQFAAIATTEHEGDPAVEVILSFESGRLWATVTFGDGGIDGFLLEPVGTEWTPPAYADESAFSERTLTLQATESCSLGATLTVPNDANSESAGTVPGVVIVHGQGPLDRDGTYGPNRIYRDLAWGLASRGVAVLRYDKRSYACDVDLANVTIDDVITADALTAVDRLRETDAVAADDILVIGHSTGGTLAPRIAKRDGDLAGIAMLAALHRPVHEAIVAQNEFLAERDGVVTDVEERSLRQVRALAERIRTLDIADDETAYLGGDEYWRTLQEYDHDAVARNLDVPQLYCQGGRDWQVTIEDDLAAWQSVLEGKESASFETYDALNHLFMPGEGTPSQVEYYRENHVAEAVIGDLAAFATRVASE